MIKGTISRVLCATGSMTENPIDPAATYTFEHADNRTGEVLRWINVQPTINGETWSVELDSRDATIVCPGDPTQIKIEKE